MFTKINNHIESKKIWFGAQFLMMNEIFSLPRNIFLSKKV